ncbi:MAG: MAPEG family protein [Candidatus Binatia bacterium]
MTTDLWMLIWTVVLAIVFPFIYAPGRLLTPGGAAWAFGNRDQSLAVPDWTTRAVRAHQNLTENLAPFAILVLVAHVTGKANSTTALGATMFFWGRVAHALVYTAGIVYLRTIVFFIAAIGELLILFQLLG